MKFLDRLRYCTVQYHADLLASDVFEEWRQATERLFANLWRLGFPLEDATRLALGL